MKTISSGRNRHVVRRLVMEEIYRNEKKIQPRQHTTKKDRLSRHRSPVERGDQKDECEEASTKRSCEESIPL